jgi:alpha-L-arabinofuranosidase
MVSISFNPGQRVKNICIPKYIFFLCFQIISITSYSQSKNEASITLDLSEKTEKISPMIYGQFIEYLGRCIYGGIYEEGSPLSGENGFRKDVLEEIKGLKTPLLRFPGGTVTKIYHWKDGIGAKSERPKRKNLIWGGINDNHFGTVEFIEYCREIGAEPFLVVNMSTGSPEEASDWVEYCNGTEDTYYANLRRSHGYEKPFNVKYWGIGNEEYATPDAGKHQNVNKYIEDGWQFVKLMKLQDPSIKLTLVGNPDDLEWSRKVVAEMNPVCDFLSIHFYSMPSDSKYTSLLENVENFNKNLDSMRVILKDIPAKVKAFPQWYRFPPRQEPVKIAVDEWGIWDMQSGKGTGTYNLEYSYNWSHALAVARFLNIFQRNADIIGLATWAQTVNVLAPIMTNQHGSYLQTVYTPLQGYRRFTRSNNLPVTVNSPLYKETLKSIDATASISDNNNEVVLSLLNLSGNESVNVNISFTNIFRNKQIRLSEHIIYTAPSLDATNTFGKNNVEEIKNGPMENSKKGFEFNVQPASINFFIFKLF